MDPRETIFFLVVTSDSASCCCKKNKYDISKEICDCAKPIQVERLEYYSGNRLKQRDGGDTRLSDIEFAGSKRRTK